MRPRMLLGITAVVVACVALLAVRPQAAPAQPKEAKAPPAWEYRQVVDAGEAVLNALGKEGWELVTVMGGQVYVQRSETRSFAGTTTTTSTPGYGKITYVFKRLRR